MADNRQYTKKQYTGNWSAFGTGAVFALVGIIGIILRVTGTDFIGLASWGYYMFIPAFFIILGGISGLLTDRRLKRAMLVTAQSKGNSSIKLEALSAETNIQANDILRILLDLRNEGLIKYKYESTSGEIVFGESVSYQQSPEFTGAMTTRQAATQEEVSTNYCPYCGHKPPAGAQFCESCGSKLI
ncbi:MAG: zinc ribbon domain-containing protein [Candidatus Heimdallarchaeaceae archaeon]|jgi:hypothetical protein